MTVTLHPPVAVTADELLAIALRRLDRIALRVALSTDLGEVERHADIADLSAAYAALRTHQILATKGGA